MKWLLVLLLSGVGALPALAASLSDAFNQGAQFGRSGNVDARARVNGGTAGATVPGFTTTAPPASYFGGANLNSGTTATLAGCEAQPSNPPCLAVNFSQSNPSQRPSFSIPPNDPLITRAKTILANPATIAGNIAGTYSSCTVQTITGPDIFETLTCNQARVMETLTCDKILIVSPIQTPGCTEGEFLTRVTADPCPACIDYLAYDFRCGATTYLMHAFTIAKATGAVYMELGSQYVPASLNTEIPMTPGPSQIDAFFCYQTYFSQSCSGANCSIGAWFYNPCQGTSYYGVNTFAMPTTVTFTDTWDNQCLALEARSR